MVHVMGDDVATWLKHTWLWIQANPDVTAALAAVASAVVAIVAIITARISQDRANAPYVLINFEPGPTSRHFDYIRIKNYGLSEARKVEIMSNPPLIRVNETTGYPLPNPFKFAFLAPGEEVTAFFDSAPARANRQHQIETERSQGVDAPDVPSVFKVTITYWRSRIRRIKKSYSLDLKASHGLMYVDVKTMHDLVMEVQELRSGLNRTPDPKPPSGYGRWKRRRAVRIDRKRMAKSEKHKPPLDHMVTVLLLALAFRGLRHAERRTSVRGPSRARSRPIDTSSGSEHRHK